MNLPLKDAIFLKHSLIPWFENVPEPKLQFELVGVEELLRVGLELLSNLLVEGLGLFDVTGVEGIVEGDVNLKQNYSFFDFYTN